MSIEWNAAEIIRLFRAKDHAHVSDWWWSKSKTFTALRNRIQIMIGNNRECYRIWNSTPKCKREAQLNLTVAFAFDNYISRIQLAHQNVKLSEARLRYLKDVPPEFHDGITWPEKQEREPSPTIKEVQPLITITQAERAGLKQLAQTVLARAPDLVATIKSNAGSSYSTFRDSVYLQLRRKSRRIGEYLENTREALREEILQILGRAPRSMTNTTVMPYTSALICEVIAAAGLPPDDANKLITWFMDQARGQDSGTKAFQYEAPQAPYNSGPTVIYDDERDKLETLAIQELGVNPYLMRFLGENTASLDHATFRKKFLTAAKRDKVSVQKRIRELLTTPDAEYLDAWNTAFMYFCVRETQGTTMARTFAHNADDAGLGFVVRDRMYGKVAHTPIVDDPMSAAPRVPYDAAAIHDPHADPVQYWVDKHVFTAAHAAQPPTKEATTMSFHATAPLVKTQTLVNGVNVDVMSDDQLFGYISQLEAEIAKLNAIENKPKALEARINKYKADIADIVALADKRIDALTAGSK